MTAAAWVRRILSGLGVAGGYFGVVYFVDLWSFLGSPQFDYIGFNFDWSFETHQARQAVFGVNAALIATASSLAWTQSDLRAPRNVRNHLTTGAIWLAVALAERLAHFLLFSSRPLQSALYYAWTQAVAVAAILILARMAFLWLCRLAPDAPGDGWTGAARLALRFAAATLVVGALSHLAMVLAMWMTGGPVPQTFTDDPLSLLVIAMLSGGFYALGRDGDSRSSKVRSDG